MLSITPVRERISERFPVASFVVSVPSNRYFEVACTTDPRLFRSDHRHHRTTTNFATSRGGGLLRAPAGQATYIIPPGQLRQFAGAQRLYYAVGAYLGARNENPVFTVALDHVERTPSIQIAPDFTGRSLDRGRIGQPDARYGSAEAPLVWGGDEVIPAPAPRLGDPTGDTVPYDDGFDAALWTEPPEDEVEEPARDDGEPYGGAEPFGFEDAAELGLCASEPAGYEHAAALPAELATTAAYGSPRTVAAAPRYGAATTQHHERYGSVAARPQTYAEPQGYEDIPDATRNHGRARYGHADAEGYEDIPDVVRNLGPGARYGNGAAAVPAPIEVAPAGVTTARFPEFSDELAVADALPPTAPALDADHAFTPANPRHRLRLIGRVASAESGAERYRALGGDTSLGLAWGYVQLVQRHGGLGHALRVCLRRDRAAYVRMFGEHNAGPNADDFDPETLPPSSLLRVTNASDPAARLAGVTPPTGGAPVPLWQAPWPDVFRAAGDVTAFQEAQREVADRRLYLPYIDLLRWLGIRSVRGHAMFVDAAIQMGGGAAARWFTSTAGPIRSEADLTVALAHLGHPDLRSFQAAPGVPGVTMPAPDGVFGALSHAALTAALRHAVDAPLPVRTEPEMLAVVVADAEQRAFASPHWRTAARRLRALADDAALVHVPGEAQR